MTDLHDGVAGHLLSISALAGSAAGPERLDTIQRAAKSAIVDLRLIVESLDEYSGELLACLTQFRGRVDQLMRGTGMQVEWALSPALIPAPISQESALNLVRILQEMIHNAIRHSGGSRIQIDIAPAESESVCIRCRDDGQLGSDQMNLREGTGIRNMRLRAERSGADLEVCVCDTGGVEIILRLHLAQLI
jgi:signal transduction histidine kinase